MYRRLVFLLSVGFFSLLFALACYSDQPPSAPAVAQAFDTPNDGGGSITLEWELSADDGAGEKDVIAYAILRSSVAVGDMEVVGSTEAGSTRYVDDSVTRGKSYYYIVRAQDRTGNVTDSQTVGPVTPIAQWFNRAQLPTATAIIVFSGIVLFCIYHARAGKQPFIRRISGLEAIDEAIGRATEMGRSILYVSGIGSIGSIATIASMNVLSRVARMAAEYDTPLYVPCSDPVVMNIEREVVQNAHLDASRPDTYKKENVFFITEEQFAYAAAVDGIIIRERPAAIFYMGAFMAESLILAEVGSIAGAIQVAGTDSITQLPFFITACDHTLMGEELYAASAYLSKDPLLLGSLKGQDWGKLLAIAAILAGVALQILGINWFIHLL
jgi:hypothetical protein